VEAGSPVEVTGNGSLIPGKKAGKSSFPLVKTFDKAVGPPRAASQSPG